MDTFFWFLVFGGWAVWGCGCGVCMYVWSDGMVAGFFGVSADHVLMDGLVIFWGKKIG
jgi:hypothetical protein